MNAEPKTLPTTCTYPTLGDRQSWYFPTGSGEGVLVIRQGRRKAVYAVQEDTSEQFPARTWLVKKAAADDPEAIDVYAVTADPTGWRCACKGFVCHRGEYRCAHVDALRAHFKSGELDYEPLPQIDVPTEDEINDMALAAGF